jgi:hypothetical protein
MVSKDSRRPSRSGHGAVRGPGVAFVLLLTVLMGVVPAWAGPTPDLELRADRPSWSVDLRTTGYSFQSADRQGTTADHFQLYQGVSGSASGLANGVLTVRAAGRFADDLSYDDPTLDNSRFYNGVLEARLPARMKARLGRQFVQSGVTGLTLDGLWFDARPGRKVEINAWGGSRAPYDHGFSLGNFDTDAAAGGQVVLIPLRRWRMSLAAAYRERDGGVAARPLGVDLTTSAVRNTRLRGRAAYDLEQDRWSKLELQARWRPAPDLPMFTFQYLDRAPTIDAVSWFSRFANLERIRLLRANARWESRSRFGGELEYLGSFVDTRTTSRIGLAALLPCARIGYSLRFGDAGEDNLIYGEIGCPLNRWLRFEAEASHQIYALLQDAPAADERDLTTFSARLRADLRPGLRVLAEVQSLENPLFSSDTRFLFGIDLSMARGASRYGLDRGRWLP